MLITGGDISLSEDVSIGSSDWEPEVDEEGLEGGGYFQRR